MKREQAEQIARRHANAGGSYYEMLTDRCVDAILEAVAIEREACAKVCEERYPENYGGVITEHPCYASSNECAEAIRARGER